MSFIGCINGGLLAEWKWEETLDRSDSESNRKSENVQNKKVAKREIYKMEISRIWKKNMYHRHHVQIVVVLCHNEEFLMMRMNTKQKNRQNILFFILFDSGAMLWFCSLSPSIIWSKSLSSSELNSYSEWHYVSCRRHPVPVDAGWDHQPLHSVHFRWLPE